MPFFCCSCSFLKNQHLEAQSLASHYLAKYFLIREGCFQYLQYKEVCLSLGLYKHHLACTEKASSCS